MQMIWHTSPDFKLSHVRTVKLTIIVISTSSKCISPSVTPQQQQPGFSGRGPYSGGYRGSQSGSRGIFRGSRSANYRGGRTGTRPQCNYCGLPGHFIDKCRKKMRDETNNQDFGYSSSSIDFSTRRYAQNSINFFFFHVFSHPSITNSRQFDWFADSGATQHMTDQLSMLHNFVATTVDDWLVTGIGDSKLIVKGKGEVVITSIVNGKSLNGNNICPLPLYKEKHH